MMLPARLLAQGPSESKLEELLAAAHFYVISYTAWPSKEELRICVPPNHRLKDSLNNTFSNRVTAQRRMTVVDLSTVSDVGKSCEVAILTGDLSEDKELVERIGSSPVLTVSSEIDVTDFGGMIYLPKGKPPRILLKQVNKSGLRIDSALLAISEIVQ